MPDPGKAVAVEITPFDIGTTAARLYLVGTVVEAQGEWPELGETLNAGTLRVHRIEARVGESRPISLALAPIEIPGALVAGEGETLRLATRDELRARLEAAAEAARPRFLALVAEAQRRILSIEVDRAAGGGTFLGVESPFTEDLAMGAFAAGHVRLRLWTVAGLEADPSIQVGVEAELAAYAKLRVGGVDRTLALVCAVRDQAGARLRVDADDFNLSLPEFELPSFAPFAEGALPRLKLADGLRGAAARAFQRLGARVKVEVLHTNPPSAGDEPELALRVRTGASRDIDWALVRADFDADWADPSSKLAELRVTVRFLDGEGATVGTVTIEKLRLANVEGKATVEGTATAATDPVLLENDTRRLGPLDVSWKGVSLVAATSPVGGATEGMTLRGEVAFARLTLRIRDDPTAVLALAGRVEITPSGARIVELRLVEPYPLVLVAAAAGAILQTAASVVQVVFDIAAATAGQAEELLAIVGRIAAAVGRSAVFLGAAAAQGAAVLGELVARGLQGVAEIAGSLFGELARLAASQAGRFVVELRIGTDPFELRQILVTLRGGGSALDRSLDAAGFKLTLKPGWEPGVLIDLITQPGAYLVMSRHTAGDAELATLATDLWLTRQEADGQPRTAAVRDADPGSGEAAADKPLLGLAVRLADAAAGPRFIVAVAGLSRGRGVFLQRAAGDAEDVPVATAGGATVMRTSRGPFVLVPLRDSDFAVEADFQADRVLPLLGMGDPGAGPGFLGRLKSSLATVVWVRRSEGRASLKEGSASIELELGLKAAGLETSLTLNATLSLRTLEVTLEAGKSFPVVSRRIEERALGLVWIVEQTDRDEQISDTPVEMFRLGFVGAQSGLELNEEKARMELRFEGLSADGKGVAFRVETFRVGPGGLDLVARATGDPVRLNGIDTPFSFNGGRLEIRGGSLVQATVAGRGSLPASLIGEADCTVALTFAEDPQEGIVLQSGAVDLEKRGDPVVCHGTRFTLTITDLDLSFVKDRGYHFYFLVTGSLRFTPRTGEFERGLLQFLNGVELNLERTPLAADPRVLLRHIGFQKSLNPKKTFNLFNLFTFEVRGFGYHPASARFGGDPAVNISGQIRFAELGDIARPEIDFHGLWIAPPAGSGADGRGPRLPLPRVKADGLGVDLNLKGSIRVRGSVLAVDPETPSIEGTELAPPGYDAYGFMGEGAFEIPGWANLAASLGFLEVERKDRPGERRKSFFLYGEQRKIAVEIPTPIWVFYLREAGFGFGFRYTLEALRAADQATSVPGLIAALDDVSRRQGDLHRFAMWRPEAEGDNVTLALKGVMQPYPAEKRWTSESEKREELAENPFLFDVVAAIRSDFTLFMGVRGWLATNYIDYLRDKDGLRSSPGLRGYLYISAPQRRLLARMLADRTGYIGESIPSLRKVGKQEPPLRRALRAVDWSATLFIKPGLFHYELGWPNQLAVHLLNEPNMRVTVRGGMIFRVADDGLLWAYNVEAEAFFRFSGSLEVGPVGVSAEASLDARFVARLICYLSWRFKGSLLYGLVSLDATLSVSIRAWLKINLVFKKITIRIGFSISLHFSAAVELAISTSGVGGRVHARVGVSAFGRTLSIGVGFTLGGGQLEEARARVQRFLAMSITAEQPDTAPSVASRTGDQRLESDARHAEAPAHASPPETVETGTEARPTQVRAQFGHPLAPTDFWVVLHRAGARPDGVSAPEPGDEREYAYALLVPQEPLPDADGWPLRGGFYAAPSVFQTTSGERFEEYDAYTLKPLADGQPAAEWKGVRRWKAETGGFEDFDPGAGVRVAWNAGIPAEEGASELTLAYLFDECFLSDTEWKEKEKEKDNANGAPYRVTTAWAEPPARFHERQPRTLGGSEEERAAARDTAQRERAASAAAQPWVEEVHQARSTTLSMFFEQFVTLARSGRRSTPDADVTDLGLVFYGPVEELEQLARLEITKCEHDTGVFPETLQDLDAHTGTITVLNPRRHWFENEDPVLAPPVVPRGLADDRNRPGEAPARAYRVAPDGIKLDWRLGTEVASQSREAKAAEADDAKAAVRSDPEFFLHHYLVHRTLEGRYERTVSVKPADTIGGCTGGRVELLPPDSQFCDELADLPVEVRRALLPAADEALAREVAIAWATHFADEEQVQVLYSVTPVDIAGTRGLPKSFVVEISQPQPPLTPAEAELRFVVRRMGPSGAEPHTSGAALPGNLGVVIALRDASWLKVPYQDDLYTITRSYRLIAVPEDVSPSGHYGTDGLTERRLGPPSGMCPSAGERVWIVEAGKLKSILDQAGKVQADPFVGALEPDRDTLKTFPLWGYVAGKTGIHRVDTGFAGETALRPGKDEDEQPQDFLQSLWRREGESGSRIATRFALETVQRVTVKGSTRSLTTVSKRVPVSIEVRVEPLDPAREIGLSRPEAFEWPVHLEMPPHAPGQVWAESGFARFRVPAPGMELAKLREAPSALKLVRDAERRVLTQVTFDAAPVLDPGAEGPAWRIDPAHRTAVAGYDLHELDLDELARLDTSVTTFAANATTWRRARRVARVERVSAEMARLLPDANHDWQGWQAHYPSETWRLVNRTTGRDGRSKPIRAPWYSAAESTLHFPERVPRLRLLPTVPESAVSALLADGIPTVLTAHLRSTPADPEHPEEVIDYAGTIGLQLLTLGPDAEWPGDALDAGSVPFSGKAGESGETGRWGIYDRTGGPRVMNGKPLKPAHIRAALLRLGLARTPSSSSPPGPDLLYEDPARLNTLSLEVEGWAPEGTKDQPGERSTGHVSVPLEMATTRHPLLEEVLGELEYQVGEDALYRGFVVTVQAVQPGEAASLDGFMAATLPEADPYGWGVLHQLGLAATIKVYDRDQDRFLDAGGLLARVDRVMSAAVTRYRAAYGLRMPFVGLGAPFVEVLLKPGRDRVPGPFGAVLTGGGLEPEEGTLFLEDDALSIAQLSLRPAQEYGWRYYRLEMAWEAGTWPETRTTLQPGDGSRKCIEIRGYELCLAAPEGFGFEAIRAVDDALLEVTPGKAATIPLTGWPRAKLEKPRADPGLVFFLRVPAEAELDPFPATALSLRARVRTSTYMAEDPPKVVEELVELMELKKRLENTDGQFPLRGICAPEGGDPVAAPVESPTSEPGGEPFERFPAADPDRWADRAEAQSRSAFASLLQNLHATQPRFPRPPSPVKPATDAYRPLIGAYLAWSQRFLDHAAAPPSEEEGGTAGAAPLLPFALAAPVKAHPWQLAADANGRLTLSFLHADRWAHARAYAVRPTGRYENLALGAGYYPDPEESERLVTPRLLAATGLGGAEEFQQPIGYAVAVSPRTERIEPPVFLGSGLATQAGVHAWELVLARHGEEALASANRSLFARLGTQGVALSFVRQYRYPKWPEHLRQLLEGEGADPVIHPAKEAELPAAPTPSADVDAAVLKDWATAYPSLWKGADLWRIGGLPAHYRVTALAAARAGLVVSRVVRADQDATPRRPLNPTEPEAPGEASEVLGMPRLTVEPGDTASIFTVSGLRLVSHAALSLVDPKAWEGANDVAWWPDPEVTYTLLRRGRAGAGSVEDEDAVVRLVTQPAGGDASGPPVVVRCRGKRYTPAPPVKDGQPAPGEAFPGRPRVATTVGGDGRAFALSFSLSRANEPRQVRFSEVEDAWGTKREEFNAAAASFAELRGEHLLEVSKFPADTLDNQLDAAKLWLNRQADRVEQIAGVLIMPDHEPTLAVLRAALRAMALKLRDEAIALQTVEPWDRVRAHLLRARSQVVTLSYTFNDSVIHPLVASADLQVRLDYLEAEVLSLGHVPAQAAADAAAETGHPVADRSGGALWRLCRELLLGGAEGFRIRALDTRNAIESRKKGESDTSRTEWVAPGETEIEVMLPAWAQWGEANHGS